MTKLSNVKKRKMDDVRKPKRAVGKTKKRKRSPETKLTVDEDLRRLLSGKDDKQPSASLKQKSQKEDLRQLLREKEDGFQTKKPSPSDLRLLLRSREGVAHSGQQHSSKEDNDAISKIGNSGQEDDEIRSHEQGEALSPRPTANALSQWSNALSEAHAMKVNVTVVLENANLETVQHSGRSGGVVLLNSDDHRHILQKTGRDANDARPDITHQCLLALQDSPLNKAGRLKVYIRTTKNVLIDVHSQTRIPRTIKRFSGLMAELLEKFKVRGTSGSAPLLKVIRNPITSHLPVGARKIVCTYNTDKVVDIREHASDMAELVLPKHTGDSIDPPSESDIEDRGDVVNVVYVVGAMAHGKVTEEWADDNICISEYPLSAATVCSRITYAYEAMLGIL